MTPSDYILSIPEMQRLMRQVRLLSYSTLALTILVAYLLFR